jgi:tetratricopeptide (TPR) repeat protein
MASNRNLPHRLLDGLMEAEDLLEKYHDPAQALEVLQELHERYPKSEDVLGMMANAYLDLGDRRGHLNAFYRMHQLAPNRAVVKLGLAGAYMSTGRIALAYQTFSEFFKKWKHDERVEDAKNALVMLETALDDILPDLDPDRDKALEFAAQHELVQVLMEIGDYRQARRVATRLLKKRDDFMPLYNNLSLIAWLEGDLQEAALQAEKVLTFEAENIHALSNLARYKFLLGEVEQAHAYAERLIASEDDAFDFWLKKFEALVHIEQFEQVLKVFEQTQKAGEEKELNGLSLHWVASAFFVTGDEKNAKKYWRKARKKDPTLEFPDDNLAALKKTVAERDCPQILSIDSWLSRKHFSALEKMIAKLSNQNLNDEEFYKKVQENFDKVPEILSFVRSALKYGTSAAKDTALKFLDISGLHPALVDAVTEFAFGQTGTDQMRLEAFQILSKYGAVSNGESVELYLQGEWKEIRPMNYEISYDPFDVPPYPKKVLKLIEEGTEALRDRDGKEGERCFGKALALYGDDPTLLNNYAVSLEMQGKIDESDALAKRIVEEFPDYFFGQVINARKAIHTDDMDKAKAMMERMASRKKLHVTEFSALCDVHVQYFIKSEELNAAMSWYHMWQQGYPDDPNLHRYAEQMELIGLMEKFQSIDDFGKKKH